MTDEVLLDFETANRSGIDLKQVGAWVYSEDPTVEILTCRYIFNGMLPIHRWRPVDAASYCMLRVYAANPKIIFIAHNAGFEKAIWRNIMVKIFGFPDIPNERWHCSLSVCAYKVIPLELDKAVKTLRLPIEKDTAGSTFTKGLSKPDKKTGIFDRTVASLQRVDDYCEQDIRAELPVHQRVGYLSKRERQVWLLDQTINERGIGIDQQFVAQARKIVAEASGPLELRFKELTGLKVTQNAKVKDWVHDRGVMIPDMRKETLIGLGIGKEEEDLDEYNENDLFRCFDHDIALPDDVKEALEIRYRIGSASIKKLHRMAGCACRDGSARGLLQYHGAGPGRWAGRLVQPQNFPRGTIKATVKQKVDAILTGDWEYIELMLGPAVETVVSSLRHALMARVKRMFCSGDYSGIEARVVLTLAGQWDKVKLLAEGKDVYLDMASQIFGFDVLEAYMANKHLDHNPFTEHRQTGKNSVLGLGFQMGWKKFWIKYCSSQGHDFAKKVVHTYRKVWAPKVPKLWYALEDAAVRTVHDKTPHEAYGIVYALEDGWLTARLPSGRKLYYWNPQPTRRPAPWDATEMRLSFTYEALKKGMVITIDAFGGLLTENVVQAIARDIMVDAMFRCERENLPIVLTVHDEILTEPELRYCIDAPEMMQQIMEDVEPWTRQLQIPINVECWKNPEMRYHK